MSKKIREEVINVVLAQSLRNKGLDLVIPETVEKKRRPDVIVGLYGLRVLIEGREESFKKSLLRDTAKKLEEGYGDIGIAILYPKNLYEIKRDIKELEKKIEKARFSGAVFHWDAKGLKQTDFYNKDVKNVVELIREVLNIYVKNDVLKQQVKEIKDSIEEIVETVNIPDLWLSDKELMDKLMLALGISDYDKDEIEEVKEDILRIASFILLDALLFHEVLSGVQKKVNPISSLPKPFKAPLIKEWNKIILEINYVPVFKIGLRILRKLPSAPRVEYMLEKIANLSTKIAASGTYLRHDLMGRIYHKLLLKTTGKRYATYYTSIPAAVLLSNLIIKSPNPDNAWEFGKESFLQNFRIIDPASGSGTLLSAVYSSIRNEYVLKSMRKDLITFHKVLLEKVIYGLDVLDYASHLTLTSLSLHNPRAVIGLANIYTLPVGALGHNIHLGSLDYLKSGQVAFQGKTWSLPLEKHDLTKGKEEVYETVNLEPKSFDMVIMNPPFSRSARPNIKFGFATEEIKKLMNKELKKISENTIVKLESGEKIDLKGIGQAGLGAYFIFVADKLLKGSGRLGIVIPRAFLSGVSWKKTRELLYWNYEIEYIISNFDPGDRSLGIEGWNWSENTSLGEVLIIARKTNKSLNRRKTLYINLYNKPVNAIEALLIAQEIQNSRATLKKDLESREYKMLECGSKEVGSLYFMPQKDLNSNFLYPCIFSNAELNWLTVKLNNELPSIQFNEIIKSNGVDIKQIKMAFKKIEKTGFYKILWGHQSSMNAIELGSTYIGYGRTTVDETKAKHLYSSGAKFLLAERPHLKTECLLAANIKEKVLATAFWELKLSNDDLEQLYTLWFNSTFGFLFYLQYSVNSMGEIFKCKKEHVKQMKVIDPRKISIKNAKAFYKIIKKETLKPFPKEFRLASEGKGVKKKIDDFFIKELKLKIDLTPYYKILSEEPILTLERL